MDVKRKLSAILRPLYGKDAVRMECFKCKRHGSECPECSIEYEADYLIDNCVTIKENAVIMETPPIPTIDEVKKQQGLSKHFVIAGIRIPKRIVSSVRYGICVPAIPILGRYKK